MGATQCNLDIIWLMTYRNSTWGEALAVKAVMLKELEGIINEYMERDSTKELLASADITFHGLA